MIIDYMGGVKAFQAKGDMVAFEQGNSLLLFDTVQDSKIKMHNHVNPIVDVCFCDPNLIASISLGYKNQLMISEFDTLNRVYSDFLPFCEQQIRNIYMKFATYLVIIEVHVGYRVIIWDIKQMRVQQIQDLESVNICCGSILMNSKPLRIGTVEVDILKLWQVDKTIKMTNRITIKGINEVIVNQTLKIMVCILSSGGLMMLNSDGDLISQLKSSDFEFTSAVSWDSYLYLSTKQKKILIYEASTLNFIRSLELEGECVQLAQTPKLLIYLLSDGSLITRDIYKNTLLDEQIGHSKTINQVTWDPMKQVFYSASSDGCFGVALSKGDKFSINKYKISQMTKVKCILIDNYRDDLYLGDSRGQLLIYSLLDYSFKRMVALNNQPLQIMTFSPAYQYLGVVFKNGFTILLDCENQLKPMLKLEDAIQNIKYSNVKLFQLEFDLVRLNTSTLKSYHLPRQDKHFNSITLYNQHTIRQHQISKGDSMLSALALNLFTLEGLVYSFDLHPSKEYLFALSSFGFVHIFKLKTGEQRAKINVPPFSRNLAIDRSGLYFAISHLVLQNSLDKQFVEIPSIEYLTTNNKINVKIKPTNIRIYESGTGHIAEQINNVFEIKTIEFSTDAQFLVVGGKNGKLSLWGISEELVGNAVDVIDAMKINPFFWRDFPIYIDESEVLEQDLLDLELLTRKPPSKNINKPSRFNYVVNPQTVLRQDK